MFRQLVGLVLLSLAAFGLSPAQADQAYLYQGPTQVEVFEVEVSATLNRADTLQPTLDPLVSGVSGAERTYYTIRVNALTNGSADNIDVIAVCFYSPSSLTNADVSATENCGYTSGVVARTTIAAERSTMLAPPVDPSPAHILAMEWSPVSGFTIRGTNAHTLGASRAYATEAVSRLISNSPSTTATFTSKRLDFNFALSHAAVNTSDWTVRVVSVSTADSSSAGETAPTERVEHVLQDIAHSSPAGDNKVCSNEYSVNGQLSGSCSGSNDEFGVNFFGGFLESDARPSVNYGVISENSSSASQVGIRTGRYFANDSVSMSISGSDFSHTNGQGTDTLGLVESFPVAVGTKGVALNCLGLSDASSHDEPDYVSPSYTTSVVVRNAAQVLFGDLLSSSSLNSPENSRHAPNHECKLYYGSGATYGNEVYTNTITLGLFDADTNTGPSATGVYQEIAVTATPTTTVTERNTNPVP